MHRGADDIVAGGDVGVAEAGVAGTSGWARKIGAAMMLISAAGYGSSGPIARNIDATTWQIATWRGLVGALVMFGYVWCCRLRKRSKLRWRPALRLRGLALAVLCGSSMFLLIAALERTAIANVTVIMATIPFIAAGLAWVISREKLRTITVVAASVSLLGVCVTVFGSLGGDGNGFEGSSLDGTLMAVALSVALGLLIVLVRRFDGRGTGVDAVLGMSMGGVMLFVVALPVADPFGVSGSEMPMLVFFGAVLGVATVLWTEGVKLIPAAEAGLLGTAETPYAIVLAWLVLSEAPPVASVIGGVLVLGAVGVHAGRDLALNRVSRPWLRPRARPRI